MCNASHYSRRIHIRGFDFALNILLLIGQEVIGVIRSSNVILTKQPVQRFCNHTAQLDFIRTDIIRHQDDNVIQIRRNILIDITDQIQQFQYVYILHFKPVAVCSCPFAALNHIADAAIQEGMDAIIETIEWYQGMFIRFLNHLCRFLEA